MPQIHADLQAAINRARSQTDQDVAVEVLEEAIDRLDVCLGNKHKDKLPKLDSTIDEALNEARTHIRNDDLHACRIRFLQVIAAGGPAAVPVDETKSIHDMKKAELVAYAAAQEPPIEITASGTKAAIIGQIQEAHDARNVEPPVAV